MKKILILLIAFISIGGGTWWFLNHKNDSTTLTEADKDFACTDVKNIGRIFMADRRNHTIKLDKVGNKWTLNDKYVAKENAIKNLLETVEKIRIRYVPSKNAVSNIVKDLSTDGVKVEIFDKNGQKMKCYYVGGTTNDNLGTHVIMEGSETPYICEIPTMQGEIRARYMMNEADWRDKAVFSEPQNNIQAVSVEYLDQKSKSFKIDLVNGNYVVNPFYEGFPKASKVQKKNYPESYLVGFESIIAEGIENQNPKRELIANTEKPFAVITLTNKQGITRTVRLLPIQPRNEQGEILVQDGKTLQPNRYFADCNNGDFFLVQDGVFRKLFWDYSAFF